MFFALAVLNSTNGPQPLLFTGGNYYDLAAAVPGLVSNPSQGLLGLLEDWDVAEGKLLKAVEAGLSATLEQVEVCAESHFLPLVLYPQKVICTGMNYYDHLRKDGGITNFDKTARDPLFFMKHSRALMGSGGVVRYPSQSAQLDWEVELAVLFGKSGRRIAATDAMSYVAGYAVGIDLSTRDWMLNSRYSSQVDFFTGKTFDDSAPLGPHFVPARFVDPTDLALKLSVNGELRQDSTTKEMIWTIAEQVSLLSQIMTIEPGDVLFTGTPSGCGIATDTYLSVGDEIEAEITGLGKLTVTVIEDPEANAACKPPVRKVISGH
jgi:2-keto-4-pentenoate hydratase/2-oxohepta-3-ene-1,7-dioic acid hydratase in catechol pathway